MEKICRLFGVSRQAYYQYVDHRMDVEISHELMIKEVLELRKLHPRMGTRKLWIKLSKFMIAHGIKMGRDALFDLLSEYGLLIRKRKRTVKTTQSHHWLKKYPNLIKGFIPTHPNQLWVSDITYWEINTGFVYISLITDAYSHKIVGYHLSKTLEAEGCVKALTMATSWLSTEEKYELVHHSDRGVQYCSGIYVKLLEDYDIKISMTENGDPLENAIAERVNRTIKEEYLDCYQVDSFYEAKELIDQVIRLYNEERPHMSISNLTPELVHNESLNIEKKWKNYYREKQAIAK
jgi:transposase InsO family protein